MNIHPRHPHNGPEAINGGNQPGQAVDQVNAQNGVIQVLQEQPAGMQAAPDLAQPAEDRLNVLLNQKSDDEEELLNVLKQMTSSAISGWKTPKGTSLLEAIFDCGRPRALEYFLNERDLIPSEELYKEELKNYINQDNALNYYDSCMMPKGIHSLEVVKAMLEAILQGLVNIYNKREEELIALVEESLPKSTLYSISSIQTKQNLMTLILNIFQKKRQNRTKSSRCVS